jgi:hypothetical protein
LGSTRLNGAAGWGDSVAIHLNTFDRASCNERIKTVGGLLPTAIVLAVVVPAKLIVLGRINAPEPNARPVNF